MSFLTYASYLELDTLLSLQKPQSSKPEHDETLFIVIHQVYELWFKQMLHEARYLQHTLESNDVATALHTLRRMCTILKTMVAQVDILETMTPLSFSSFRGRLQSASGFQSLQFRELEFLLGQRQEAMLQHHPEGSPARRRLEELLDRPSLYESFLLFIVKSGFAIPEHLVRRDRRGVLEASPQVQAVLIDVYRSHAAAAQVCERLVDLDEGMQEWRYRHVKMVERTIGTKTGTGGSPGAAYLKSTLFRPCFPDLWAIRAEL